MTVGGRDKFYYGRRRVFSKTVLLAVLLLVISGPAVAQMRMAALRGRVQDLNGSPVSGAAVVAKNLETGQIHTASTDEEGEFEILELEPGTYELQATQSGFAAHTQQGLDLEDGQLIARNVVLNPSPGGQSESNRVAESSSAANRISEAQLVGLPLNGRSYSQLATLQAGVSDSSAASASRGIGGGSLTVSGSRPTSNNFLLDGTNIQDTENNAPRSAAGVQLGSDAVFQVQVLSSSYGAEYGRSSGGVLNSITRSGSNEFHGTFFEYFRNSKLDARNFFDQGANPPPFKRNQFGFTLSGPLKKDRTFFMGNFEGLRDRFTKTELGYFPDERARRGEITNADGQTVFYEVDPAVKPYLELYPIPNDIRLPRGIGRYFASQFLPSNESYFTVRVDHKMSERDSLFVRYTFDDATSRPEQEMYLFLSEENSRQQYLTLTGSHIFSLRRLDAFRLSYTRPVLAVENLSSIEIPGSLYFVPDAAGFGQIQIPGINAFGPNFLNPKTNIFNSFQFSNDVILQNGAHTWKIGGELHRYRLDASSDWFKGGVWSFNSLESFLQAGPVGTGITVALPGSDNRRSFRQTFAGLYVQDEYKMNPRLQLNLGLRYEPVSLVQDRFGKTVYVADLVRDTQVQRGDYIAHNPSWNKLAPRVGITWSPWQNRSTVLSAGFGIYYDQILAYVISQRKSSAPFYFVAVNPNFNASCQGAIPTCSFPDAVAAAAGVLPQVQVTDYQNTTLPMVLRYHFSVQQQFTGGWRAQATYVGARGNHLLRRYETNQFPVPVRQADGSLFFPPNAGPVNPAFGAMSTVSSDAQSFYNSLQLSANRALRGGASVQASYTYSKSIDDSSVGIASNFGQYPYLRTLDRGLSDFDIRHRLSVNYFYTLPFGSGQPWVSSGLLSRLLGGWRLGGIASLRSGVPFTAGVRLRYRGYLFEAQRPNLAPGASNNPVESVSSGCGQIRAGQKLEPPDLYFDPCAFSVPPPGTLGNLGRNTLISSAVFNMDVSVQREFLLDSKRRLQFRADLFNVPNHTNFNKISGSSLIIFSGEGGNRTAAAGRIGQTATTSRQIQFALRLSF